MENGYQIAQLREQTKCSLSDAVTALSRREGILEFAIEYLQRRDLPKAMSPAERYPLWHQYIYQKWKAQI